MSCLHEEANLYHKIYRLQEDIYKLERLIARPEMEDNKEYMQEQLIKKKDELKHLEGEKRLIESMIRKEFAPKEEIPKDTRTYTARRKEKARKKKLARHEKFKKKMYGV